MIKAEMNLLSSDPLLSTLIQWSFLLLIVSSLLIPVECLYKGSQVLFSTCSAAVSPQACQALLKKEGETLSHGVFPTQSSPQAVPLQRSRSPSCLGDLCSCSLLDYILGFRFLWDVMGSFPMCTVRTETLSSPSVCQIDSHKNYNKTQTTNVMLIT